MSAESVAGASAPACQPPYFDGASSAWILSRYSDVVTALRHPDLWPVSSDGEDRHAREESGAMVDRAPVRESLSGPRVAIWETGIAEMATARLEALPLDRPVDLLNVFAIPWGLSVALFVMGADQSDRAMLSRLGNDVFAGNGAARGSVARARAAHAVAELNRYFQKTPIPMAQSTFVGISQTLPRLLANGWLAFFRRPDQVRRLRAKPELMPRAVEELLRVGGLIACLYRKARVDLDLGDIRIAEGERVNLLVASANRDPDKFPEPERLDISRRAAGQLALGMGPASCAGAQLIRVVDAIAISGLLHVFSRIEVTAAAFWHGESGLSWPTSVQVMLGRDRRTNGGR
jgi:cytochrome P450